MLSRGVCRKFQAGGVKKLYKFFLKNLSDKGFWRVSEVAKREGREHWRRAKIDCAPQIRSDIYFYVANIQ